ncbi:ParA family protein [Spirochaeta lutea]|uniref:Chromosome partitioning protein n=1 Tax=Spirochaeta lutea TaxID=1480694 RepID=A0A098QVQ7_9SPIO|nr:ParA family protein [Spirochaeta lutea]KGE71915.1 chromosome partitioning protein [Spirochaeta lutea]
MGTTIVFANQKGGVGKTTSAANLGAYLAELGKKVLLIDFDPQGNLSSSVGADRDGMGIYELITGQAETTQVVQSTKGENLFVIPASIDLTGATVELVGEKNRELFLKRALEPLVADYDYLFIDCPPSLGILTLNGLTAADAVYIPLQTEYFALEGLTQLIESIKLVQKSSNPRLVLGGIFFTMYDSRTRLAQDVVQEVVQYFGKKVFKTIIPRNIRLSEAPSHGLPINQYDPGCSGAKSYRLFAQEVLSRG